MSNTINFTCLKITKNNKFFSKSFILPYQVINEFIAENIKIFINLT